MEFLKKCSFSLAAVLLFCSFTKKPKQPADYVNPFIGATTSIDLAGTYHGLGKTFPGATTPFGMVQVSPNTISGGDNGSGYSDEHRTIEGFALTQMSGVGWYGDLGNFLVMPTTGLLRTASGKEKGLRGYRSAYDKTSEKASSGYYSVLLTDYDVKAELTAAAHSGFMRFTFPENKQSRIQIDLARRVGGTATSQYVKVVNDHAIEGWMKCTPDGGGWGNGSGLADYTVYFYAEFSKPFENHGVWSAEIPDSWKRKAENVFSEEYQAVIARSKVLKGINQKQGKHLGFYAEFGTRKGEQVLIKTGISYNSINGAKSNLGKEIPDWNFDKIKEQTWLKWNEALSKIKVTGGTEDEKTIFYTALYRSQIDPRTFEDLDGNYFGGDGKIHQSRQFTKRTIFSGWDVFRSQMPLQTLINPVVVNDLINSLVTLAGESRKNYLERWEMLNAYSGCMIGNPAVSVIADAYRKNIRNFDVPKAYQLSVNSIEQFGNGERGFSDGGYSIANTLEYAYNEWCVAMLAKDLGKTSEQEKYAQRSMSYKNIFDPEKKWFRPKDQNGNWQPWPEKGRLQQDYGCVESNPYQQGWFVPHDVDGMVKLMGGKENVIADLNTFFDNVPADMKWNDYYNHPNEPVHHVAFLYNRIGTPWLTQKRSRDIVRRAYHNSVEGLVGNEDVGQMSAWYVLASAGLYPVCPGDNRYEIASPLFNRIDLKLDARYAKGKVFTIIAENNSPENIYIQKATLNGSIYNRCYLSHDQLIRGGTLILTMGNTPNMSWGIEK